MRRIAFIACFVALGLLLAAPASARTNSLTFGVFLVNGTDPFSWTTQREFRL